jgi:CO/xanthine dehydrogenase FAD-binding subunit
MEDDKGGQRGGQMIPKKFEYYRARDVEDALEFISTHEDSKIIAGGQSLVPLMKLRIISPSYLVDIGRIKELRYIRVDENGELRIGALTTHSEIEESPIIKERWPVLSLTAEKIADVQIRSRGSIGGSLCHADPAADYLPTLLVLDARVVLRSKKGRRVMPLKSFIVGPFTTAIEESEILEEVIIPQYPGKAGFEKFARREGDLAIVNVAALLNIKDGAVGEVRVAVGGAGPTAMRLTGLEEELKGKPFNKDVLEGQIERAIRVLDPPSDVHGSSEYRREVAKVIIRRLLLSLFSGGE